MGPDQERRAVLAATARLRLTAWIERIGATGAPQQIALMRRDDGGRVLPFRAISGRAA